MKRFTLGQLILCCAVSVVATVGFGLWMRAMQWHHAIDRAWDRVMHRSEPPAIDHHPYLLEQDAFYRSLPAQDLQEKRLADQAKLFEAYQRDPAAFLKGYSGVDRIFLFDAVIDGKKLFRAGTFNDGGKWLSNPQTLRPGAVVYSFGVGNELSFDVAMAGLFGCEVHAFDPGPSVERSFSHCRSGRAIGKGRFWYRAIGLGPTSMKPGSEDELVIEGRKCPVKRLSELAAELGHSRVDVLKIDIEGGEMAALLEILSSRTLEKLSVGHLLVEFHLWDDEQWSSFVQVLRLLREQGYLIFRKEFNPLDNRCAEFAFLGLHHGAPAVEESPAASDAVPGD